MYHPLDRRNFLKAGAVLGAGFGLSGLGGTRPPPRRPAAGSRRTPKSSAGGWDARPGRSTAARSSRPSTRPPASACTTSRPIPGQKISKEITAGFGDGLSAEQRKTIKQKLADSGVKLVNFGVVGISGRKTFDFAKDMGIETIVSEPARRRFPEIGRALRRVRNQYGHSQPPQAVALLESGHGAQGDQGAEQADRRLLRHGPLVRSGLNAVECLKKLEGRIISFHFKDVNKSGHDAHDVPWGTGISDVKGMLTEIHRQGVKAVFSIEYEYTGTTPCRKLPSASPISTRSRPSWLGKYELPRHSSI